MARPRKETGKRVPGFTKEFETRMEQAIEQIGGLTAATEATGGSVSQLIDWKFGRTPPNVFALSRLCEAANKPLEWLVTGESFHGTEAVQPLASDSSQQETGAESTMGRHEHALPAERGGALPGGMVLLPRLNVQASAGHGIVPEDDEIEDFLALKADLLREMGVNPRNAHVLMIKGNSMYPTLHDRDVIIVDASVIEALDEGLFTLVLGDTVRAKRLQPLNNGGVRIISDNKGEGYADEVVPPSEMHTLKIVGRICGVYRTIL